MAGNTPMLLSAKQQEAIKAYLFQCYELYDQLWSRREIMLKVDRQYARETDRALENSRAKIANFQGDSNRFQNITIPIVLPQVESAVTYQTSVFLTGIPLFGVASSPTYEDEAIQLETAIDDQAIRGGWTREFTMFFRDGAKYNIAAVEVVWDREITAALETNIGNTSKPDVKQVIWEGNCVKRWDMYNAFYDTRVNPAEMYRKGEFAGKIEMFSRVQLKKLFAELPDIQIGNVTAAFDSPTLGISIAGDTKNSQTYYIPDVNPNCPITPAFQGGMNWDSWAGIAGAEQKIRYQNQYQVTTLYARIIPQDFGIRVPAPNTPQVWKFIFVNNSVLIYAERQTNAHGYLPVLFSQPLEDGLGYQTKSLATNVAPIQDITSALSNSDIAARRRAVSDRVLYDPSRITEAHINNPNPSAKIPVRPAAFGKNVAEAVYAFPFRDDQSAINSQKIAQYTSYANVISGSNPVRQGQFVKGNKTQSEFDSVMANANGRDQVTAIGYETQVFTPLKEILKLNILQYQGGVSLFSREKESDVQVDPVALRKAVTNFKVSDGLTPLDKQMDTDTFLVALQQIGSSPALAADYNIGPLFSYIMKLKGAKITPFEKSPQQKAYEQAVSAWQQAVESAFKANPNVQASQIPPQPTPDQYGYNPNQTASSDVTQVGTQPQGQQPQQQQPQNPGVK